MVQTTFQADLFAPAVLNALLILFVVPTNWFASGELLPALYELVSPHDFMRRLWGGRFERQRRSKKDERQTFASNHQVACRLYLWKKCSNVAT
ncbi:hypothetical protein SAMN04515695_0127 [Pseudovibrio sp. Tun.PSC04-5.I4]|nr:hypothetical protein SAMN04515695_0127 [Pseudovibrio sp. Tun.PSC04-5.I4]